MLNRKIYLNQRSITYICFIILGIGLSMTHFLVQRDIQQQLTDLRSRVVVESGELRNRIEYQIHSTLSLMLGSLVYVSAHPDLDQKEFERIAAEILRRAPHALNLGLAKDNVISHIYPLAQNKAALGLRYMDNPIQKAAVLRAIETRNPVLAGPVKLIQGGEGLINRVPIFLNDADNSYWGMASIVISMNKFYKNARFNHYASHLKFAIRGKDGLGESGDVFFGDPGMFKDSRNAMLSIPLPNGRWQMAVAPLHGWVIDKDRAITQYVVGSLVSLFLSVLIYLLLRTNIDLETEKNNVISAVEHKNRFFTYMTHELRTPLTSIYGVLRMLSSTNLKKSNGSAVSLLENAERNCERLMCLINDMLDLRKLELGHMQYKKAPVTVDEVVSEAVDEVQQYAKQFSVKLAVDLGEPRNLMVFADAKRIIQVLVNLLSNAIKFSPAGSQVEVSVSTQGDSVCLAISDSGPGIDINKINRIFTEFSHADHDGPMHKIPTGTGLGLAICKKLVDDQGGSLSCFNAQTGGAVFYFILPKYLKNNNNLPSTSRMVS